MKFNPLKPPKNKFGLKMVKNMSSDFNFTRLEKPPMNFTKIMVNHAQS